jgi:hypothetical protein
LISAWRRASANIPFAVFERELKTWVDGDSWWDDLAVVIDWECVVDCVRMSRGLRDARVVGIVEDVQASGDGAPGVAANVGDVHPALVVGFPPLESVLGFTDGIGDEREVGDASGGPIGAGVYPFPVVGGGVLREAESSRDICDGIFETVPIEARSWMVHLLNVGDNVIALAGPRILFLAQQLTG